MIVGVEKPPEDETYIIDGSIPIISQVRNSQDRNLLKIDDGYGFPFDEFKFIVYFPGNQIIIIIFRNHIIVSTLYSFK